MKASCAVLSLAQLVASCTSEAEAWFNALPTKTLKTWLRDEEMRSSMALSLGTNICYPHICRCGDVAACRRYHGLSCDFGGRMHSRHDEICDLLCATANTAGLRAKLELVGPCRDDTKRPDIVTSLPVIGGKPWAVDFTCANTVAPTYLPRQPRKLERRWK